MTLKRARYSQHQKGIPCEIAMLIEKDERMEIAMLMQKDEGMEHRPKSEKVEKFQQKAERFQTNKLLRIYL